MLEAQPLWGQGAKILVVDHDPKYSKLLKETLEKFGPKVIISPDSEDALLKLAEDALRRRSGLEPTIAALVTEYDVPPMGIFTGETIGLRARSFNPAVQVLILTDPDTLQRKLQNFEQERFYHLPKDRFVGNVRVLISRMTHEEFIPI